MKRSFTPEIRNRKKEELTPIALSLFLERGVDDVKMTDIANSASIGVATLYRYFSVKKSIVIASGILLWKKLYQDFLSLEKECENKDGYTSLKIMMNQFLLTYEKKPSFFIFLRQFDSFCIQEKILPEELNEYDNCVLLVKNIYDRTIQKGIEDHSIQPLRDKDTLYFTMTKAFIGLAQKLISEENQFESDSKRDKETQLKLLLEIFLTYYRK